jgi:hypothetical protein
MEQHALNVIETGRTAGIPTGTLGSWRSRYGIEPPPYSLADAMSLALAATLAGHGLPTRPSIEIGRALKPQWGAVSLADPRETYLLVRRGVRPGEPPFVFMTTTRREDLAEIAAGGGGPVMVLPLLPVARDVLVRVRELQREREEGGA